MDRDPAQPATADQPLYGQIERGVHALDAARGRAPDETSARLAAALLPLAKQAGLSRVDHVLLSEANGTGVNTGENVFVVQGDPANPAHLRACMKTADAIAAPAGQSFERAAQITAPAQAAVAPQVPGPQLG